MFLTILDISNISYFFLLSSRSQSGLQSNGRVSHCTCCVSLANGYPRQVSSFFAVPLQSCDASGSCKPNWRWILKRVQLKKERVIVTRLVTYTNILERLNYFSKNYSVGLHYRAGLIPWWLLNNGLLSYSIMGWVLPRD